MVNVSIPEKGISLKNVGRTYLHHPRISKVSPRAPSVKFSDILCLYITVNLDTCPRNSLIVRAWNGQYLTNAMIYTGHDCFCAQI